uniref:DUF6534 domain-containing protein n=1 Tax=Psilocybe cubensis TaxID=181762 RepID=A0A8H7Y6W8_PSICU
MYQRNDSMVLLLAYMGVHRIKLRITVKNCFYNCYNLAINGFNHKILTGNTPDFVLAFKLATSSQIAYDIILTTAMTWTLQRARVGSKRTDHVVKLLMLFIINTNLLTTILSIVGLVTFLVLPHATVYGAIGFILGKTYFNAFLSILNAREYLREKFDNSADIHPDFADAGWNHEDTEETATGTYELSPGEIRFASHKVGITREEA